MESGKRKNERKRDKVYILPRAGRALGFGNLQGIFLSN